jgi:hypothetical protein
MDNMKMIKPLNLTNSSPILGFFEDVKNKVTEGEMVFAANGLIGQFNHL